MTRQPGPILGAVALVGSTLLMAADVTAETAREKRNRKAAEKYEEYTGMSQGSVVNLVQKGFGTKPPEYTIWYLEDVADAQELAAAPETLCHRQRQADVALAEPRPTSAAMQDVRPNVKILFVRCTR
ncbi:hypothetical protein BOO69_13745 [Sulfitobacter alexandrii]|uniref:Uncharacterized protein n=1 Tax=Sulfitobacter alexandrii TaxID=1917485 RepID=A0A1J0WJ65_9RHOB|nr:hypothetical protein [Sulfitobacter alexandrii]APE44347.1 hypothetical protein BOO69_13745 [Sulfitobacter alexandrii]